MYSTIVKLRYVACACSQNNLHHNQVTATITLSTQSCHHATLTYMAPATCTCLWITGNGRCYIGQTKTPLSMRRPYMQSRQVGCSLMCCDDPDFILPNVEQKKNRIWLGLGFRFFQACVRTACLLRREQSSVGGPAAMPSVQQRLSQAIDQCTTYAAKLKVSRDSASSLFLASCCSCEALRDWLTALYQQLGNAK